MPDTLNHGSFLQKRRAERKILNKKTTLEKGSFWVKVSQYFKTQKQAGKIMNALNEAEEIHAGRKKGASFDQFLKEI